MNPWSIDETVLLVRNYATMPLAELSAQLADFGVASRSIDAIHARARYLDIHRENAGKFDGTNGNPPPKNATPLRDKIVSLFAEREEMTLGEMKLATGAGLSSCWKVCKHLRAQGNIHIVRYDRTAVYRIGGGEDAKNKAVKVEVETEDNPHEIQPIPRPVLGAWGCVWNTTKAGQAPAERITAS